MTSATPLTCSSCGLTYAAGIIFCDCGEPLDTAAQGLFTGVAAGLQRIGPLPAGTPLGAGRYTLERHLAQGGMGSIYLAFDARKGVRCVVKEMLPKSDPQERAEAEAGFKQEAAVLAELHHEHIVSVWDSFEENGSHYLVEEAIAGGDLTQLIHAPTPLTEQRALELGTQIAEAFQYIHTYYLTALPGSACHGPIIYRDMKPANVMLHADGRAIVADFGIVRLFKPGKVRDTINLGTLGYAAPEMINNARSDVRSDLYTLGATLHELLTKKDPGNNVNNFAPVRQTRPDLSTDLERILARLLEDLPDRRHQTAAELLVDLRQLQERWRAVRCPRCQHQNALGHSQCSRCQLPLLAVTGQHASAHGDGQRLGSFRTTPGGQWRAAWKMDLKSRTRGAPLLASGQVVIATESGNLDILDVRDGRGLQRVPLGPPSRSTPVDTPYGLLIGHRDGASLYQVQTSSTVSLPLPAVEVFSAPVFDGHEKAFLGTYGGQVICVNLRTMQVIWTAQVGDVVLGALAYQRPHLAVTTKNGQVTLLVAETGQIIWTHRAGQAIYSHPLLADDAVVVMDAIGRLTFLDRERGTALLQLPGSGDSYNSPALSNATVFTADQAGLIRALTTRGDLRWERPTGRKVLASPILTDAYLIVSTRSGHLLMLDPDTGLDRQPPLHWPVEWLSSPVADGNTLVALDQSGAVVTLVN